MLAPQLLKTEINGTSTWFTELCTVTAAECGHTSLCLYLSAIGTEDPDAKAEPTAVVASSPAAFSWKPRDGESELLQAGGEHSLCLLQAWAYNKWITSCVTESWLFSDHPVLPAIVRWSWILRKLRSEKHRWMRLWKKKLPKDCWLIMCPALKTMKNYFPSTFGDTEGRL